MKTNFLKVLEFHKTFGLLVNDKPRLIDNLSLNLRLKLMEEEFKELYVDMVKYDAKIENIAKELADLLYVVYGTAASYGIDIDKVFDRVHISNMSKLDKDGNVIRRNDGKILKSELYEPVKMDEILKDADLSKFI